MNHGQLYNLLLSAETDCERAPDARRILSSERQLLGLALERVESAARRVRLAKSIRYSSERGPAVESAEHDHDEAVSRMIAVATEARRVATMWGVEEA